MKFSDIKVGEEYRIKDDSWCFGIENGFITYALPRPLNGVVTVTQRGVYATRERGSARECDLVIESHGHHYFMPSSGLVPLNHTITIDGKDIEISDESYENLRKQFR